MKRLRWIVLVLFGLTACSALGPMAAQTAAQPKKPVKRPAEPIDPDATAGVRGSGFVLTVRVLRRGKPASEVYVVAKNPDGSVAGTGTTNEAGRCLMSVGAGDYVIRAAKDGSSGSLTVHLGGNLTVLVKLAPESPPRPPGK